MEKWPKFQANQCSEYTVHQIENEDKQGMLSQPTQTHLGERAIALHGMYESPSVTNQTKILDKLE